MSKYKYNQFLKWKANNDTTLTSENVLLAYFDFLSSKNAPNTVWSIWSMLKSMIKRRENINIKDFSELQGFIKTNSKHYRPKKAPIFSNEQVYRRRS